MSTFTPLPVAPALLGESPLWHPDEQVLYWVDIPGRLLHRWDPLRQQHRAWPQPAEPASIAPLLDGGLLLAARDGIWRVDTRSATGSRSLVAAPPYDPARQRFNDGKADPWGRFWVATLDDARRPQAALYCLQAGGVLRCMVEGISVGNGLAFSPDGSLLLLADTKAHTICAYDLQGDDGSLSRRRDFARFDPPAQPAAAASPAGYGGRPDGAAMDSEGAVWVAMFEGQRLLRLAADGSVLAELPLPVRCPTMPCFGGHDLRTLYLTTARHGRAADELAAQPLAGCVLQCRVEVPGLPACVAGP